MAKVALADILKQAEVPKELRDDVREMIVIGTGKTVFTPEEAQGLVRAVRKMVVEGRVKRQQAVASTVAFKREHKPRRVDICPICRERMVRARLRDDRPVYYCPTHRVVLPIPTG